MSPRDSVHLYALARVEQPVSARVEQPVGNSQVGQPVGNSQVEQPVGNSQAAFVGWLRRRR